MRDAGADVSLPAVPRLNSVCLECGGAIEAAEAARAREFCCSRCRQRFNNRRLQRGAEIYDLYMAHRFDRPVAKILGLFQAINRLASDFRREDREERQARRSWRRPQEVLEARPHLKAERWHVRAGR